MSAANAVYGPTAVASDELSSASTPMTSASTPPSMIHRPTRVSAASPAASRSASLPESTTTRAPAAVSSAVNGRPAASSCGNAVHTASPAATSAAALRTVSASTSTDRRCINTDVAVSPRWSARAAASSGVGIGNASRRIVTPSMRSVVTGATVMSCRSVVVAICSRAKRSSPSASERIATSAATPITRPRVESSARSGCWRSD